MSASFVVAISLQFIFGLNPDVPEQFATLMLLTVGVSTVTWLVVTALTKPEKEETLRRFYNKVRPGGIGWRRVQRTVDVRSGEGLGRDFLDWVAGCVLVYSSLFCIGKFIFGEHRTGALYLFLAIVAGLVVYRDLSRRGWKTVAE